MWQKANEACTIDAYTWDLFSLRVTSCWDILNCFNFRLYFIMNCQTYVYIYIDIFIHYIVWTMVMRNFFLRALHISMYFIIILNYLNRKYCINYEVIHISRESRIICYDVPNADHLQLFNLKCDSSYCFLLIVVGHRDLLVNLCLMKSNEVKLLFILLFRDANVKTSV